MLAKENLIFRGGGGDQRGGWPLAGILPKLVRVLDR